MSGAAGSKRKRSDDGKEASGKKARTSSKSTDVGHKVVNADEDSARVRRERVMVVKAGKSDGSPCKGPIILWMSRDYRLRDNHALLYAADKAIESDQPLVVCFNLVKGFLGATIRQFGFMLDGLKEVEGALTARGVPFVLLQGNAADTVPALARGIGAAAVVTDLTTVRIGREWRRAVAENLSSDVSFEVVDAHNVVPVWVASPKLEYAARTIRSKIHKQLGDWFLPVPSVFPDLPSAVDAAMDGAPGAGEGPSAKSSSKASSSSSSSAAASSSSSAASSSSSRGSSPVPRGMDPGSIKLDAASSSESCSLLGVGASIDWAKAKAGLQVDRDVQEVDWITPGEQGGARALGAFCDRLKGYSKHRNDASKDALSCLSPYFHFGQLSPLAANLAVRRRRKADPESADAFFEESVIRRELSDNYCFYNPRYDQIEGLYPQFGNNSWAQVSLRAHAGDRRPKVYTYDQLDRGETHDELWNACQMEMVVRGKMHGFCRMLWAKKILEWTESPQQAMDVALYLNDRYELDGRDPNGYVGVAWSVAGVHDQGWKEREVFGKIRYMSSDACKKKFDVAAYVAKVRRMVDAWRRAGGRFASEAGSAAASGSGEDE